MDGSLADHVAGRKYSKRLAYGIWEGIGPDEVDGSGMWGARLASELEIACAEREKSYIYRQRLSQRDTADSTEQMRETR